ncbi:MAG: hypothetical protein IKP38_10100 [Clostridia bacterium]|nr:hypothetical protein [Clostridia bacterium]
MTEDGDAREARDGTSVTQRSEVVKKTRIVCDETIKRKGSFAFSSSSNLFHNHRRKRSGPFYDSRIKH